MFSDFQETSVNEKSRLFRFGVMQIAMVSLVTINVKVLYRL